jgi:hypothetical protein
MVCEKCDDMYDQGETPACMHNIPLEQECGDCVDLIFGDSGEWEETPSGEKVRKY